MKRYLHLLLVFVGFSGCPNEINTDGPPREQLYFPSGMAHLDVPGKTEGVLLVANANLDKRYSSGSIVAISLDALGLPPLGTVAPEVKAITELKIEESQSLQIASFAGELAVQSLGNSAYRVYVPTRSEGMRLYQVEATIDGNGVPTLNCINDASRNCFETGVSLAPIAFARSDAGVPRAPDPYGVITVPRVCATSQDCCEESQPDCGRSCTAGQCMGTDANPFADVWVSHLTQADSPLGSNANFRGYLVRLDSDNFSVSTENFIEIGAGGSNSMVALGSWVYTSGRVLSPLPNLVRLVSRERVVLLTGLESLYRVAESRGIAVSSDKKRLYLAGRAPDRLLIASIDTSSSFPVVTIQGSVSVPPGPNTVRVIPRAGKADLVAVTCSSSSSLVIYDDEVGEVVSTVRGLGAQPFDISVSVRGNSARLFVGNFGDGRISVVDVSDLNRPHLARLVAHLGAQQLCMTRGASSPGCIGSLEVSP